MTFLTYYIILRLIIHLFFIFFYFLFIDIIYLRDCDIILRLIVHLFTVLSRYLAIKVGLALESAGALKIIYKDFALVYNALINLR